MDESRCNDRSLSSKPSRCFVTHRAIKVQTRKQSPALSNQRNGAISAQLLCEQTIDLIFNTQFTSYVARLPYRLAVIRTAKQQSHSAARTHLGWHRY